MRRGQARVRMNHAQNMHIDTIGLIRQWMLDHARAGKLDTALDGFSQRWNCVELARAYIAQANAQYELSVTFEVLTETDPIRIAAAQAADELNGA